MQKLVFMYFQYIKVGKYKVDTRKCTTESYIKIRALHVPSLVKN